LIRLQNPSATGADGDGFSRTAQPILHSSLQHTDHAEQILGSGIARRSEQNILPSLPPAITTVRDHAAAPGGIGTNRSPAPLKG
jgi:hypothetical protein